MTDARRERLLTIALFVALALTAVAPIRSYDFFWHLATGQWIVEQRALPATDPFAVASDPVAWINGEWLFEVILYPLYKAVGAAGLSWIRGLLAASLFTAVFVAAKRRTQTGVALLLTAVAFAGAMRTFDVRPSSSAPFFVVAALLLRSSFAYALLTAIWINVHPSALLAPLIAALRWRRRGTTGEGLGIAALLMSAIALLVNPWGLRGVLAPLELMSYVGSGVFVNAEWRASSVTDHPLLYVCIAIAAIAFAFELRDDPTGENSHERWSRIAMMVLFAWLAARHVRHQTIFFAAFPLLVAPAFARLRISRALAYSAAVLVLFITSMATTHGIGAAPSRFPIAAVARLKESGLRGNIYNPDQFGGYLVQVFYPERRALTDGRNELFHQYLSEYARARGDQRAWRALLLKYRIDLAVDEYRGPLKVVDASTGSVTTTAASLAYWPRDEWALIAFDEVAMVFARRAAFAPSTLSRWELRGVPDAPSVAGETGGRDAR